MTTQYSQDDSYQLSQTYTATFLWNTIYADYYSNRVGLKTINTKPAVEEWKNFKQVHGCTDIT